jgi:hypothetical protein
MQDHHNLIYREEEREMFPTLKVRFYQSFLRIQVDGFYLYRSSIWELEQSPGLHLLAVSLPARGGSIQSASITTRSFIITGSLTFSDHNRCRLTSRYGDYEWNEVIVNR